MWNHCVDSVARFSSVATRNPSPPLGMHWHEVRVTNIFSTSDINIYLVGWEMINVWLSTLSVKWQIPNSFVCYNWYFWKDLLNDCRNAVWNCVLCKCVGWWDISSVGTIDCSEAVQRFTCKCKRRGHAFIDLAVFPYCCYLGHGDSVCDKVICKSLDQISVYSDCVNVEKEGLI